MSYAKLKSELNLYRSTNGRTNESSGLLLNKFKVACSSGLVSSITKNRQSTHNGGSTEIRSALSRIVNSGYFQLALIIIVWIIAIHLEFGAVWFVLAALYWLWVWGTETRTRVRDQTESVLSAGFFFDTSPIPKHSNRMDIRRSIFNLHAKYVFPIVHRALTRQVKIRSPDPPYLVIFLFLSLQLDIKCRDFVVLERFCRYLEQFVKHFNLEVYGFALPANRTTYRLYHPNSTKVRTEFELSDYIRIYRVSNMKAIHLPIFMDLLYQNLPEGVQLSVDQTNPDTDEARFVPQLEVHALQEELAKLSSG
ncbi:hypothetical protein P879_00201 [Paragonimus westermani]|uniref:Small ribosomal subunit protein uS10 domain-containing protein n=1 Tax=Paragonimus westermani TaxID=34504 RepID=A0A8T0DXN0_9TREM|nr:hypothetical protein P879_00201 [Paragonimus westermani]